MRARSGKSRPTGKPRNRHAGRIWAWRRSEKAGIAIILDFNASSSAARAPGVVEHHLGELAPRIPALGLQHGRRVEGVDVAGAENGDRHAAFGHAAQLAHPGRLEQRYPAHAD